MDVFVARQPIFTTKKEIYAYELLFRTGLNNSFPDVDGNTATTSLLSSSFFTVGIDKISGGKLSFINFTEDLILEKYPQMFPQEKIMIEILEDVEPTEEIVAVCSELKSEGYRLALDDFVYEEKFDVLLPLADIIKVDFLLTPADEVIEIVEKLKKAGCQLLAEKIESYEEFEKAKEMGFTLFQGYFFSKPEVLQNKEISSNQAAVLQLVSEVTKKDFDFDKIEKLVNQDVSISYKLIRYLNSAYFNRVQPLSSIRQAIAYLGEKGIRQFISLVSVGQLASNKPNELIRLSITRAKFLEQIGNELEIDSGELFLLGLFSLIEAMLDTRMSNLVEKLPLSENISNALAHGKGEFAPYLQMIEAYEGGQWDDFVSVMEEIGLSPDKVSQYYLESIQWAESFHQ